MKLNIKGFTLVELMGVIIILSLIVILAAPPIIERIKRTQGDIDSATLKIFESAVDLYLDDNSYFYGRDNGNTYCITLQELVNDGKLDSSMLDVNVGEGYDLNSILEVNIVNKNLEIGINNDCEELISAFNPSMGVNRPQLASGMTPIKWDEERSEWVSTTRTDSDWYSYTSTYKKWANARTADGSMWVWVPRYAYQIATNYHTNTTGNINIKFLQGTTNIASAGITVDTIPAYSGSSQTNYIKHPSFTFGSTELTGIWVAKFEATAAEGIDGYSPGEPCSGYHDDVTTKTAKILPNVQAWRCISIGNAFTVSRNMEKNAVYGWGTSGTNIDTHLIKNGEWGAAAYLANSVYGKNAEVWGNPTDDYTTGCAGTSAESGETFGCTNAYNTANGMQASTTGNIYGIYDLSGGSFEYTSAYVNDSPTNGDSILNAENKYKDIYQKGATDTDANNYALTIDIKGDAVYETSNLYSGNNSWYGAFSIMPKTTNKWFSRGGYSPLGGIFDFSSATGGASSRNGFRPVLLVGSGL